MNKLDIDIKKSCSKDCRVGFRIPKQMKEYIDEICNHNNITITDYFIYLIESDMKSRN